MKKYLLALSSLILTYSVFAQGTEGKAKIPVPKIDNCPTIPYDGFIESTIISTAYAYEFTLTNLSSGQNETITSASNVINLADFSIVTYTSTYNVKVRSISPPGSTYSVWSTVCSFSLGKAPKSTTISNLECRGYLMPDGFILTATPVYTADCYIFYVNNLTTGQSYASSCIANGQFDINSVTIPLTSGDQLDIQVAYMDNGIISSLSPSCVVQYENGRPFCEVIQEEVLPENPTQAKIVYQNVGNHFDFVYLDNDDDTYYALANWQSNEIDILNVITQVLLDLDNFYIPPTPDPSCGNPTQRMRIQFSPYPQSWVDDGLYPSALAVASQFYYSSDLNYANLGCPWTPNIQLYNSYGSYGDQTVLPIGTVYINPNAPPFNYDFLALAYTFTEYDLYSVLLHEITHIFGFSKNDLKFSNHIMANPGPDQLYTPDLLNCGQHPDFNTLSTSTCANVYFEGSQGNYPLYAPAAFSNGSSLSHFTDVCGSTTLGSFVMHPFSYPGDTKRCYEQEEVNALQDLDFNFDNDFNGCTYTTNNKDHVVGNHDGMTLQLHTDEGYQCSDHVYTPLENPICGTWPFIISPLTNDINADVITEAVVQTGEANATISITGGGTLLDFTALVPGVYTIAYVPGNSVTGALGLPTMVQVWVPSCSDADLDAVTCHDAPNCNQLCFNPIVSHTMNRGNILTQPSGFSGPTNSFTIGAHWAEQDITSTSTSCYASVFFWVDSDLNENYSLTFNRSHQSLGAPSSPVPDVQFTAFLCKSTDLLGIVDQTDNNLSPFPPSYQVIYQEIFTSPTYPSEAVSVCFTSNDEYDILVVYTEQVTNQNSARYSKTTINSLEFMQKEFDPGVLSMTACMPEPLLLGAEFCGPLSASYTWDEFSSGNTVSTSQTYDGGTITSPLDELYTFSMTFPALPPTATIPLNNDNCNESAVVHVLIEDCCGGPANMIEHPLVPQANSRTFGSDVDSDQSGALYYTGSFSEDIGFGLSTLTSGPLVYPVGFVLKTQDNCVEWLVQKTGVDNQIRVSQSERVYHTSRRAVFDEDVFGEINPLDGSYLWSWQVTGNGNYITDFKIDNQNQEIIITGQTGSLLTYGANTINTTTGYNVFLLKLDFDGNYVSHDTYATTMSSNTHAYVAVNETLDELYLAYKVSDSEVKVHRLNSLLLDMFPPTTLSSSTNFHITGADFDGNKFLLQVLYDANIMQGAGTVAATTGIKKISVLKFNIALSASIFSTDDWEGNFIYLYNSIGLRPSMHAKNGNLFQSYINGSGDLRVSSHLISTGALNWADDTDSPSSASIYSRGIKSTNLGNFATGHFDLDMDVNGDILIANSSGATASMYGIKYDNSGNSVAFVVNDDDPIIDTKSQVVSTDQVESHDGVNIYPNPSTGIFTINAPTAFSFVLYNMNGEEISPNKTSKSSEIDLTEFPAGVYFLKITMENEIIYKKLVKN